MYLVSYDHYKSSPHYQEHLLVKITGLPAEFRYIRRHLNRNNINFISVHSPFKLRYKWKHGRQVTNGIPLADKDKTSTFAFRIFGSQEQLNGPEFKAMRDLLMILKLYTI